MQDFVFMDEMAHFDHERIPERVVHAKGAGNILFCTVVCHIMCLVMCQLMTYTCIKLADLCNLRYVLKVYSETNKDSVLYTLVLVVALLLRPL